MTIDITPERLRTLFRPERIALVGASDKSGFSIGAFDNLRQYGMTDRTILVNRRGAETHGRRTVTSLSEYGEQVDVAYMMVPQGGTIDALTDAHAAGVRNAVVLSSGYGEAGPAGQAAEAELIAHAEALDMVVLGPNMLGYANFVDGIPVTSIPVPVQKAGPIGLLSQSGASSSAMADFATMTGVGLSYMVTLGNEAMVTAGHVLDYLVDDDETQTIAMFIETIRDAETFRHAALRAAHKGKAIVALKAGSSQISARTAAAHTGALVGDDRVIGAMFRELGIIRVDTIEDLLITAGAAAHIGQIARPGIGVVSISGGACDIIADRADDIGAELPELSAETTADVRAFFSDFGTVQNPLDVTGAAVIHHDIFTKSIEAISADPSVGVVAVVNSFPWESDGRPWPGIKISQAIARGIEAAPGPVVYVNQVLQPVSAYTKELMEESGVSYVLPGLKQAVVALHKIGEWSEQVRRITDGSHEHRPPVSVPSAEERRGSWTEAAGRALLSDAGLPVVPADVVSSAEEAVAAAERHGAVALKIVSPDIVHKSDIGGVRLGVEGADDVRAAYEAISAAAAQVPGARLEGVLVSPMRAPATELLVGVVRDPHWGPMLAVALGGILVEVLDDSVLSPLPLNSADARRMLARLRGAAVLDGVRGGKPADLDALAAVIARVGDLALALGDELVSLEINPLRIDGSQIEALDVVIEWKDK